MSLKKRQRKAMAAMSLDLFSAEHLALLEPVCDTTQALDMALLPDEEELARRFDEFNFQYYQGRLPDARIQYSNRMTAAGSCTPSDRLIKIGRKYHEIFPEDIDDTLKHEMIHLIHLHHGPDFKREARRLGTSVRARSHPALRRPPKYVYVCPGCGKEYPRQKRLRMASCGSCSTGGRYDDRFKLRLIKSGGK